MPLPAEPLAKREFSEGSLSRSVKMLSVMKQTQQFHIQEVFIILGHIYNKGFCSTVYNGKLLGIIQMSITMLLVKCTFLLYLYDRTACSYKKVACVQTNTERISRSYLHSWTKSKPAIYLAGTVLNLSQLLIISNSQNGKYQFMHTSLYLKVKTHP